METLVLTIHILIAFALVVVVLLQRSEGGGLGIGGGGGDFMTARGTANLMTRATAVLAIGFFTTTIALAILLATTTASVNCGRSFAESTGNAICPIGANRLTVTIFITFSSAWCLCTFCKSNETPVFQNVKRHNFILFGRERIFALINDTLIS